MITQRIYRLTVTNPSDIVDVTVTEEFQSKVMASVRAIKARSKSVSDVEARRRALQLHWGEKGREIKDWSLEEYPDTQFVDVRISDTLEVFTNGSDEIFIRNKRSGVKIRVSDQWESIIVTASEYKISPTSKNGNDAFRISK